MTCIDFTNYPTIRACSDGTSPNTFTDSANGVSFIIAEGMMEIIDFNGNRMLSFSTVDCKNVSHTSVTLVVRFTRAQERITFRLNFDEHGKAPAVINFYRAQGDASPANLVQSQTFEWQSNAFFDVVYDNCCKPVAEITIRTDRPENNLDNLCLERSTKRTSVFGRLLCICFVRRFSDALRNLFGRLQ